MVTRWFFSSVAAQSIVLTLIAAGASCGQGRGMCGGMGMGMGKGGMGMCGGMGMGMGMRGGMGMGTGMQQSNPMMQQMLMQQQYPMMQQMLQQQLLQQQLLQSQLMNQRLMQQQQQAMNPVPLQNAATPMAAVAAPGQENRTADRVQAKPKLRQATRSKSQVEEDCDSPAAKEKQAAWKLSMARRFLEDSQESGAKGKYLEAQNYSRTGVRRLQELVQQFPDTKAAQTAKTVLQDWGR